MKPTDEELEAMARKYRELQHHPDDSIDSLRYATINQRIAERIKDFLSLWEATREWREKQRTND